MHIQDASVSFSHSYQFQRVERSVLIRQELQRNTLTNNSGNQLEPRNSSQLLADEQTIKIQQSELIKSEIEKLQPGLGTLDKKHLLLHPKLEIIKAMVAAINGEKYTANYKQNSHTENKNITTDKLDILKYKINASGLSLNAIDQSTNQEAETGVIKIESTFVNIFEEREQSNVDILAKIKTADGRHIEFDFSNSMHRFYREESVITQQEEVRLFDPLVINLGDDNLALGTEKVKFDLDNDSHQDSFANIISDSAYIALDRNNDGIINNGSELFGAMSGNGFRELAEFDEDGNGFIDEADSIFNHLHAYRPSDNYYQDLASLNFGALYLGSTESPFRITDKNNNTLAQVRSSGFAIMEDGSARSVQQIDLAI